MANVLVNDTSLTAIGNAIREKNGETTLYKPAEMATAITAISGGGEPTIEALSITANGTYTAPDGVDGYSPITVNVPQDGSPDPIVITGNADNYCAYSKLALEYIRLYGNTITTENITSASQMFYNYRGETIPFALNYDPNANVTLLRCFQDCVNLKSLPIMNNLVPNELRYVFAGCQFLTNIDNFVNSINWTKTKGNLNSSFLFLDCARLQSIPISLLNNIALKQSNISYSWVYWYRSFDGCHSLKELKNLPIPSSTTFNFNSFVSAFNGCWLLRALTFTTDNGSPYIVNWKKQTIDLTYTGYANTSGLAYFDRDKEVSDAETYNALKNDPDWWSMSAAYSHYNHNSAVATINSLPDTSAYLASSGGTNTIKFKGEMGSGTDEGAISNLTEEEIAVAAAKGWTVSLS